MKLTFEKYDMIFVLFLIAFMPKAIALPFEQIDEQSKPGFRIRSDFAAPLNVDQGWAGELNENVTVFPDQPFRIRFELECNTAVDGNQQFRLQYKQNRGTWTDIEAHDFPHPLREIDVNFENEIVNTSPAGWTVVKGDAKGLVVKSDANENILRAETDTKPLVGLYTPPWDATEMAVSFRLAADNQKGIGFVTGYKDINDYYCVQLNPSLDKIRVGHFTNGTETTLAEQCAVIPINQWLELEIQAEDNEIEINFQDDMLEMQVELDGDVPYSKLGFKILANSTVDFKEFSFAGEAKSPLVSIVNCPAYKHGMSTSDLLKGSSTLFQAGMGTSFAEQTLAWNSAKDTHGEFEWPVVIRRFGDGAVTNKNGDTFEFRMVNTAGDAPGKTAHNPVLQFSVPPGHVGGTFIENPGRIGPWQATNGDLYFMMEPAETDNVFMMIKSSDNGRTWNEVDAENRPNTNDLESVDSRLVDDTIHIIHQVTHSVRYHTFCTSDHPTHPDTWAIRDEPAGFVDAIAQTASMAVRSDGSIVAFYLGKKKLHYSIRSPQGTWSQVKYLDPDFECTQAGPQLALGANDIIHLAYYETDGTIWYRRLLPNGTTTPRQKLATGAGTTRAEFGAVLPLIYIPKRDEVVIIYRLASGNLWERRIINNAPPTKAVLVSNVKVVTDAVDSQQAGADAVLDGVTVNVLLIDVSSQSISSTNDKNCWQSTKLQVDNIKGSWVRGNVYTRKDGVKVYGYIYDAGSDGGAGMNRFNELILSDN